MQVPDLPQDVIHWRHAVYHVCWALGINMWMHILDEVNDEPLPDLFTYTYTWGPVPDHPFDEPRECRGIEWSLFHRALLACEHMRPQSVMPSPALASYVKQIMGAVSN